MYSSIIQFRDHLSSSELISHRFGCDHQVQFTVLRFIYFCVKCSIYLFAILHTCVLYFLLLCLLTYIACITRIMRPSLGAALSVASRLSVRQSVPCLRFSQNREAVETSNLLETQRWTRVTMSANLRLVLVLRLSSRILDSDSVKITGNKDV